ncbi:hypothetical protein C725_0841 [Pacificimonas flava]|uniref:Uncharacterized protein n=1 Tax=Pacificimonas flava TaxID=1234595 RepID=M2TB99_9SPHN|nr:hypothetical protein C725_0841 [Pacificimonas flava]
MPTNARRANAVMNGCGKIFGVEVERAAGTLAGGGELRSGGPSHGQVTR